MGENFEGEKFITGREGGDYYSGFYVDWLEEKVNTVDTLGAKLDEAMRLLNESQHYVSHANYDVYLSIQIDKFLAPTKIIES